ncbi:MAG: GAP family protein [Candidatus Microthrix sp.]|uniref:GAP family protein n=1 Tax=Candidatus Neomicrothrix subdominans TaxID=2954438 RepID=A0A936TE69_9ACTN|nr:GAP family protein [Candidatus Microthrix subdominans]
MIQAIGDLLPSALGVALSPVPIIAVILMLGTPKARSTGSMFAIGWIAGLVIASAIVLAPTSGASDPDSAINRRELVPGGGGGCSSCFSP